MSGPRGSPGRLPAGDRAEGPVSGAAPVPAQPPSRLCRPQGGRGCPALSENRAGAGLQESGGVGTRGSVDGDGESGDSPGCPSPVSDFCCCGRGRPGLHTLGTLGAVALSMRWRRGCGMADGESQPAGSTQRSSGASLGGVPVHGEAQCPLPPAQWNLRPPCPARLPGACLVCVGVRAGRLHGTRAAPQPRSPRAPAVDWAGLADVRRTSVARPEGRAEFWAKPTCTTGSVGRTPESAGRPSPQGTLPRTCGARLAAEA